MGSAKCWVGGIARVSGTATLERRITPSHCLEASTSSGGGWAVGMRGGAAISASPASSALPLPLSAGRHPGCRPVVARAGFATRAVSIPFDTRAQPAGIYGWCAVSCHLGVRSGRRRRVGGSVDVLGHRSRFARLRGRRRPDQRRRPDAPAIRTPRPPFQVSCPPHQYGGQEVLRTSVPRFLLEQRHDE